MLDNKPKIGFGMLDKIILSFALLFGTASFAQNKTAPATLYYVGESITTMANSNVTRHPYIIARTSNPASGTITEAVVSFQQSGFKENSSVLKIEGNHFSMSESTGTVTGGGELTGSAWNWTFLRAEFFVSSYKMRIVDYNFFADPNSIMGHKDFYIADQSSGKEQLFMQEDVVLHVVDKESFESKRNELLGR
jgi:hypothetical protein